MMGSKVRSLLQRVLFVLVFFWPIYGLRGSASQRLTVSPSLAANPVNHKKNYGILVAASAKGISSHMHLIDHSCKKGCSLLIPPALTEVVGTSNANQAPPTSPFYSSGSSLTMSLPHDGKQSTNFTDAPLSSHLGISGSSPAISPAPPDMGAPSNTHAPMARGENEPSSVALAPSPLRLHSSESSPGISPVPHEVNNLSNPSYAPSTSHPLPLGLPPLMSPTPHEVKEPSNFTDSPLPSVSAPVTSAMPPQGREPSSTTYSPMSPRPLPFNSPPLVIPAPPEVMVPSNSAHTPKPSGSPPTISPTPHEVKEPTNTTHSPLSSHPFPSEPSAALSPAPNEVTAPSNNAQAPLASPPEPSASSPVMSPTSPAVKEHSNITHSPLPSRLFPSGSSPAISPASDEVINPNVTHAPLASEPKPSGMSPGISPTPHETKDNSNITRSPLPSHPAPSESFPVPASPHGGKDLTNITHSPLASHPSPTGSSPAMSPAPHEFNEPSIGMHSPMPSHPLPSESSPVISPASHEKDLSNITHSPVASHPSPTGSSPAMSPAPHELNEPSNGKLSPTPSRPLPSVSYPVISPAPHEEEPSNVTHSPPASHPSPTGSSPVLSPASHEFNEPSNHTLSPMSSHHLPSQSSPVISPAPHEKVPSNITRSPLPSHPQPSEFSPATSPVPYGGKDWSNATHAPLVSVSSPLISPAPHEAKNFSNIAHAPALSRPPPPSEGIHTPALAPTSPQRGTRITVGNPAFAPLSSSAPSLQQGPMISPSPSVISAASPSNEQGEHTPSPHIQGPSISPIQSPSHPPVVVQKNNQSSQAPSAHLQAPAVSPIQAAFPPTNGDVAHSPSPSTIPPWHNKWPTHPPILPPGFSGKPMTPPPKPMWAFPPPPPNTDCKPFSCQEPLTYPPPGSLCVCVLPIKVGLQLGDALYTFFPLVSELAQEIASGIFVKQSQVRVMGANAATDEPEKTIVLIDVVPLGRSFDMNTALLIFERFWHKQILIKASYFGDYDVLYVLYPGLPPSPPMAPGVIVDSGTLANGENARTIKPLGVDVRKRKEKLAGSIIAITVLSSVIAFIISIAAIWLLLLKCRRRSSHPLPTSQQPPSPFGKPSGTGQATVGSGPSSASASYVSSVAATGSAKTFSLAEMERATDKFNDSRIIGEGGFGRVYQGTLEDGTMVAVKVLKRDDHQGGREFFAEVEMLSRLHHRNLVKLIGICTEENIRCLVYELIPNGSVESHLHGVDKETFPLDWTARMKIALGAARGLAYLHEDSSPRVIHRDFKSSNILLEHDFTPKVSDFGLARTALEEGEHISTRVMGTFGYVAPEYAMTGHLLVKSDVYSYGVVLLELLTGRKPVDMSQPPGQENLVGWARPLLTSMDGLEKLIDPAVATSVSLDSVAKVAAIASMCVQPEVSHRPFMGEVVQALKLVCNESGEHGRSFSQDESSTKDSGIITGSGLEEERVLSESDIFCASAAFSRDMSGSFRRYSSSGPMKMGRSRNFWDRARGFSSGSMTENRSAHRSGLGLEGEHHWP